MGKIKKEPSRNAPTATKILAVADGVSREVTLRRPNGKDIVYQIDDDGDFASLAGKATESTFETQMCIEEDEEGEPLYSRSDAEGNKVEIYTENASEEKRFKVKNIITARGRTLTPDSKDVQTEVIRDSDKIMRQVRIAATCADIVVIDEYSYKISLYADENVGDKDSDGFYTFTGDPFTVWTIENPARDNNDIDKVKVTRTVDGNDFVYNYEYSDSAGDWKLTIGSGSNDKKVTSTRE